MMDMAKGAEVIMDKGRIGTSSKLYRSLLKHLGVFAGIAKADGDTQMQKQFTGLRNDKKRKRWKNVGDGLFDLFGQMDKVIKAECKDL